MLKELTHGIRAVNRHACLDFRGIPREYHRAFLTPRVF